MAFLHMEAVAIPIKCDSWMADKCVVWIYVTICLIMSR